MCGCTREEAEAECGWLSAIDAVESRPSCDCCWWCIGIPRCCWCCWWCMGRTDPRTASEAAAMAEEEAVAEGKGTVVVGPCAVRLAGARMRRRACKKNRLALFTAQEEEKELTLIIQLLT